MNDKVLSSDSDVKRDPLKGSCRTVSRGRGYDRRMEHIASAQAVRMKAVVETLVAAGDLAMLPEFLRRHMFA